MQSHVAWHTLHMQTSFGVKLEHLILSLRVSSLKQFVQSFNVN